MTMKKLTFILSAAAAVCAVAFSSFSCTNGTVKTAETAKDTTLAKGSIVYFDLDRVLQEYDMANDLRSVVETKVNSIQQEVNRRGSKLEAEIKSFQDNINKGLLTQSTAEVKGQKLQQKQLEFQQYAAGKQQEIAEEQAVMMNQIADAIKTFLDEFNETAGFAMIIATQGDIMPSPVVTGDPSLDITDEILEGLNAAYVKEKGKDKN